MHSTSSSTFYLNFVSYFFFCSIYFVLCIPFFLVIVHYWIFWALFTFDKIFLHLHIPYSFTTSVYLLASFVCRYFLFVHISAFLLTTSLSSPFFYPPDSLARFDVRMLAQTCFYTSKREYFVYPALSQFFEFCGPPFRSFSLPLLFKKPWTSWSLQWKSTFVRNSLSFSFIFGFYFSFFIDPWLVRRYQITKIWN